uniref:ubiquitinyl hydrolase 1 n=1 Tax=Latimeria chalumnae TaxID=7897 RepID=H2ZXH5_LATCH
TELLDVCVSFFSLLSFSTKMQKGWKKFWGQKSLNEVNMDEYLGSLGLYRKVTAKDASCLFRAVSEQLFNCQIHHLEIRKACVFYMRANKCNFESYVEGSFEKYLERLGDPKENPLTIKNNLFLSLLFRRDFILYRYPGRTPVEATNNGFVEKILLCCSNNGHYDSVLPKQFQMDAALCQAVVYEILYQDVFKVEEEELRSAVELFRSSSKKNRNSTSIGSEDANFDSPTDRGPKLFPENRKDDWEVIDDDSQSEGKPKQGQEEPKLAEGPSKMPFPYKVLKALDPEIYRNVEFDVWLDSRKELQKADYMVFAGRPYYLGDKCQVRLEPGGRFYNAHIQEVGHDSNSVTVFIEELVEKHTVPLGNLKPVTQVTPVPAWNVLPNRKGGNYQKMLGGYVTEMELEDLDPRARKRLLKKVRGKEVFMAVAYSRGQPILPPRLQHNVPSGRSSPVHSSQGGGNLGPYDHHCRPPYHHQYSPQRYGRGYGPPRGSGRFTNRYNLTSSEVGYHSSPGKRCYQSYDNFSYRSRLYSRSHRQMHCVNKESQYGFVPETREEPREMEETITFYEIEGDETAFPALSSQTGSASFVPAPAGFWVARREPNPISPGKGVLTSEEEEEVDGPSESGEYHEDYIYTGSDPDYQSPTVYAATESAANLSLQDGGSHATSPQEGVTTYSYSQQAMVNSAVISTTCVNAAPATVFPSNSVAATTTPATVTSAVPSQTTVQPVLMSPHPVGRPGSSNPTHCNSGSNLPPLFTDLIVMLPPVSFQFHPSLPLPVNEMGEPVAPPLPPPPYSCDPSGGDLPRDTKALQYYFNLGLQCYHHSYWHPMVYVHQTPQPAPAEMYPFPETPPLVEQSSPQLYNECRDHYVLMYQTFLSGTYANVEPVPPGTVYYPMVADPYTPPPVPAYDCVPVVPTYHHYVAPWPPGNNTYGSSPRMHGITPGPLHQVGYVATTNPPAHYISPTM